MDVFAFSSLPLFLSVCILFHLLLLSMYAADKHIPQDTTTKPKPSCNIDKGPSGSGGWLGIVKTPGCSVMVEQDLEPLLGSTVLGEAENTQNRDKGCDTQRGPTMALISAKGVFKLPMSEVASDSRPWHPWCLLQASSSCPFTRRSLQFTFKRL